MAKDNKTTSSCSPPTDLIRRRAVSTLQNLDPLVNRVLLSKDSAESLHLRQQLPSLLRVIHHQLSAKHAQLASLCQDIDENAEKRVKVEDCSIQFINRLVGLCELNNLNDVEALLAERRSRSEETIASLMNLVNMWSPFEPVLR